MDESKIPETSLWLATTPETSYPKYQTTDKVFDVAVAGGGIAGLLSAWRLSEAGLDVAVVEKARIVANTTGNTTAKLTSQHNLIYDFLIEKHGEDAALAFGQLNQQAIEDIDNLSKKLNIDCDFERADAYVVTEHQEKVELFQREVAAAKKLGLPASFDTKTELPYDVKAGVKFSNQAQFHPRKFLLGIAEKLAERGCQIYENTEATDIEPGEPAVLKTNAGDIKAKSIVGATKYPFWQAGIFEDATWVKLSYALGVLLKGDYPMQMYITSEEPVRTIRSHPYEGGRIMVFGGESHQMTKDYDKQEHYANLIEDVNKRFDVDKIVYRWIAGDMMPVDRMPYIGPYPGQNNIYVITGFHAWGLTWGMAASQMICDQILGKPNTKSQHFSLGRLK